MTTGASVFSRLCARPLAAMLVCVVIAGCDSPPKAGGLHDAITHYNAQRYSQAYDKATAIQDKSPRPGEREDAAYLAGLAAYQLGRLDDAERRFSIATQSSNAETSAKAKAMLGQVRLDQYRPREAATYFAEAAPYLHGEDASKAAYNASVAYERAGDLNAARSWYARSNGSATSSTSSTSSIARPTPSTSPAGGFTLQVGAFRERNRAQQAAADAQKLADRDHLGAVRMLTKRDSRGMTLYVVQFGHFPTREAAAAARSKLGKLEYIVSAAP